MAASNTSAALVGVGNETSLKKNQTRATDSYNIMITMILKGLPAKSLTRFKSVSKSFCRVISSPEFQVIHSRSQRRPSLIFRLLEPDFVWGGKKYRMVSNFFTTDLGGNILSKFDVTVYLDPIKLMLPSSLGLLCFGTDKGIWLCNPSINNELVELPSCALQGDMLLGFGFGYLDSIKGFKVVQLMLRASLDCSRPNIDCWVFNLARSGGGGGNRLWRLMNEKCPYLVPELSYPAFVKDTIYWKIDRSRYSKLARDNDFLVAFNIMEEKFRVITHPVDWTDTAGAYPHIIEHSGRLCLVKIWDSCVNMWFLEDEENCIWSAQERMCTGQIGRPVQVAELKSYVRWNGQFVFSSQLGTVVVLYCPRRRTFSEVVLPFVAAEFTPYFEGLFSMRS